MDIKEFKEQPLMGILRGVNLEEIEPLCEAVISSGLKTIEVTMNSEGAPELIQKAKRQAKKRLTIGAGTVLNLEDLKLALDSGATFIVTPVLIPQVNSYCVKNKIPVFPGALTPTEIYHCWRQGASMVKVFPAKAFGPEYFTEIKGPFKEIELLACSGVTPENLPVYFFNGASAAAFGASVFKKDLLRNKDFGGIARLIQRFLKALPE